MKYIFILLVMEQKYKPSLNTTMEYKVEFLSIEVLT